MTALATMATKEAGASSRLAPGQDQTARKARQRSIIPLSRGRAELAARFWPWARRVASHYLVQYDWRPSLDSNQAAAVGLCHAARRFNPARGTRFKTYARPRIEFAVIDLVRDERPRGFRRRDIGFAPGIEPISRPVLSIVSPEPPLDWRIEAEEGFEQIIRCLPWTHRQVCSLFYREGWTQRHIGERLGLSEGRVSQLRTQALEWLREALAA